MDELVAFVRACLDEDERVAQAATPGPWRALTTGVAGGDHWYVVDSEKSVALIHASDGEDEEQREPDAAHIARHDPARVLAEVAAKRALLAELASANMVFAMRLLAEPYADRPGWREEWAT